MPKEGLEPSRHYWQRILSEQIKIRLKNEGLSGFKLTQEQQVDAQQALKIVKPFNVSLTEAVSFYEEYHELKGAEMTFGELVDDYRII